jgi:hypothetical protein
VPALVAGVTLGARQWGPRVGGWLTALPLVAGPTLFFLAMEQGDVFAGAAALATLVSLIAVAAFGVAYGWVAVRHGWPASLASGWAAFVVAVALLQTIRWTPLAAIAAVFTAFFAAGRALPAVRERPARLVSPAWDLPLRMLGTLAVVLTVTHVADRLGPRWSGAFTPFPVALAVVLVFAHAQQGAPLALRVLHGFFPAMWGFGLFVLVVALAIVPLGPWLAFVAALLAQMTVHALVLWRMLRGQAALAP